MMQALTICQPFAHLIVLGEKQVENREWPTRYRGELLIHAGKSRSWLGGGHPGPEMAFGALVGSAVLVDCLHIDEIEQGIHDARFPWLRDHPHTEGTWCWVLDQVQRFPEPLFIAGRQKLWSVDPEVVRKHKCAGYRHGITLSNSPA